MPEGEVPSQLGDSDKKGIRALAELVIPNVQRSVVIGADGDGPNGLPNRGEPFSHLVPPLRSDKEHQQDYAADKELQQRHRKQQPSW
jgi:hypothetical protein